MSITSDLKTYTDKAVSQGKALSAQLNEATVQADKLYSQARSNVSDIADKAGDAANDLRQSAEKAVRYDDLKARVEPYVEQARGYYNSLVVERAEALLTEAKKDKRLAPLIERAEQVYGQVDAMVVQPVLTRTGLSGTTTRTRRTTRTTKSAPRTSTASTKTSTKATTRPAAKKSAPRKAAAKKSARS